MNSPQMDIHSFLANHTPVAEDQTVWANGTLPLIARTYLSPSEPPNSAILSVRAIVFNEAKVLVMRDADEQHILPGGRREAGESLEATVRREVLEESGWALGDLHPLGFVHLHRLVPAPPDVPFQRPDFLWLIYWANAAEHRPEARIDDPHELESGFWPIGRVWEMNFHYGQHRLLQSAIEARAALYGD